MSAAASYLIVDDDDRLADRLATALRARGHQVWVAYDGESALELAEAHGPDRILLDLNLDPLGMDGLDVLRELQVLCPDSTKVLVSGYSSLPVAIEAVKLGAQDVVQKPVDLAGILAAFERAAGGSPDPHTPPSLARVEWEHIQRVLADCDGNISEAARRLGVHRRTLQRKLRKLPPKQ